MNWPVISENPRIQGHYEECRRNGTSHALAEMFAFGESPTVKTDATFLANKHGQFVGKEHIGDAYKRVAEREGQNTKGKVYLSQLAEYPGDPRAWVDGRGDVQKLCEEKGWGCEGAVKTPLARVEEPLGGKLSEGLVQEEVKQILAEVPDARHVDTADLADQVREKRKPHWEK